jgi:hypothetical protein
MEHFLVAFSIREVTFCVMPYFLCDSANILSPADVGDTPALMLSRGFQVFSTDGE